MTQHVPVMLDEVVEQLAVRSHKHYVDATFGGGGYTRAILEGNAPDGTVIALDANPDTLAPHRDVPEAGTRPTERYQSLGQAETPLDTLDKDQTGQVPEPPTASGFGDVLNQGRLVLIQANFAAIAEVVRARTDQPIAGVVFDLGLSTDLLELSGRGFSFERNEPLILSYQLPVTSYQGTAKEVVNEYTRDELERVFKDYGEIRQAGAIAEGIARARKEQRIETTADLRSAVEGAVKSATPKLLAQVWQALRIEVNDELDSLRRGLEGAWEILSTEGRVVVVSFHSLEDRIVKNFFRNKKQQDRATLLTKKPLRPQPEEVQHNPRSRSARLRAAEKR